MLPTTCTPSCHKQTPAQGAEPPYLPVNHPEGHHNAASAAALSSPWGTNLHTWQAQLWAARLYQREPWQRNHLAQPSAHRPSLQGTRLPSQVQSKLLPMPGTLMASADMRGATASWSTEEYIWWLVTTTRKEYSIHLHAHATPHREHAPGIPRALAGPPQKPNTSKKTLALLTHSCTLRSRGNKHSHARWARHLPAHTLTPVQWTKLSSCCCCCLCCWVGGAAAAAASNGVRARYCQQLPPPVLPARWCVHC
jgi:hypothetical protein